VGCAFGTLAHADSARQIKTTLWSTVLIESWGAAARRDCPKRHSAFGPASRVDTSAPCDTHRHDLVPDRGGGRPTAVDLYRLVDCPQAQARKRPRWSAVWGVSTGIDKRMGSSGAKFCAQPRDCISAVREECSG
jgi:hypothetical protein